MNKVEDFVKIQVEIFKELKKHLKLIGILFTNANPKEKQSAITKNCVVVTFLVTLFISSGWFRLFFAQSTREISESSFMALIALLYIAWYSTFIWQRQKYAAILGELLDKIEKSKYNFNNHQFTYRCKKSYLLSPSFYKNRNGRSFSEKDLSRHQSKDWICIKILFCIDQGVRVFVLVLPNCRICFQIPNFWIFKWLISTDLSCDVSNSNFIQMTWFWNLKIFPFLNSYPFDIRLDIFCAFWYKYQLQILWLNVMCVG